MKRILAVLVLLAVVGSTRPARADQDDAGFARAMGILGLSIGGVLGTATLVPLIGNAVKLGKHRPSRGWAIAGIVVGSLEATAGTLTIGFIPAGFGAIVATPFLAVGATNIALGVTSLVLSNHLERARVSLVPLSGLDSTGHQMFGAAVRFTL